MLNVCCVPWILTRTLLVPIWVALGTHVIRPVASTVMPAGAWSRRTERGLLNVCGVPWILTRTLLVPIWVALGTHVIRPVASTVMPAGAWSRVTARPVGDVTTWYV